ncbi:PH domain-containing protein [Bacillus sp. S3]|uniref:PH domain-containing protein n=1 Tax=Bacillus sp. S3 TaxID=486398 RepID=UPI001681151E|nr:PH domain-containing protein [Bacillus sp. S3]
MRYYSKKGIITGVLIWGAVAFLIGSFLFLPGGPEGKGEIIAAILVCGMTSAFIIWCWFGTYYQINGNQLKIVSGPFRWKVDIMIIKSIRKTRNPLSSPALSLNRIELLYGKWDTMLISPKNEKQLCETLKKINSQIEINF